MDTDCPCPSELSQLLSEQSARADACALWPVASWAALTQSGVLGWSIPAEFGGQELGGSQLLRGYQALAEACLTTCFILSQREAACRRIRDSGNDRLCRKLLPDLARGITFATVGLSQLTTSRQHVQPALTVKHDEDRLLLNGYIPWVTGAERADYFVIGGMVDDQRQVLAVVPRTLPGVSVGPPFELMALEGSLTAEVRFEQVNLGSEWLLAGPAERVVTTGHGGTGGLETSCLALGLSRAALSFLDRESQSRPELRAPFERLDQAHRRLEQEMHALLAERGKADSTSILRARANSLVLRATQAALTAAKGTGFLKQHPTQRWARQAMFFLVWSCPRPAAEATLEQLACPGEF